MSQKAVIGSSYRRQLGLMAGMLTFWFFYCMYDGYVAYPRQREIAREYAEFKQDDRLAQWADYARSRGWPDGSDGAPGHDRSDWDIYTQYIMGYGVLPFALIYAVSFVKTFGRWIALEDDSLVTSWGQRMPFAAVTKLNKNRWKTKGIAVVSYDDQGKSRKLVLDNFKYSRDEISAMVHAVLSRLSPDQITGDSSPPNPSEPEVADSPSGHP